MSAPYIPDLKDGVLRHRRITNKTDFWQINAVLWISDTISKYNRCVTAN